MRMAGRGRAAAAGSTKPPLVLVVYHADTSPLRTAIADHLYAIGRYGGARTIYLNIAVRSVPAWVDRLGIDLIVVHTTVLALRWHPPTFRWALRRLARLRMSRAVKVALPQDEFIHTDQLCDFLAAFHVDHVLTCANEADWPAIYGNLAGGPVVFQQVLTGYLDPATVARIDDLRQATGPRTVDIAYRAWRPEFWLGRHAQLKGAIADIFEREAPARHLTTDISVREADTLVGDAWLQLLLRARWTIGVEGGASIIDRDGTLRERTLAYLAVHPEADFAEVESACFPGLDGTLGLVAISPRHFEACATRTAQVLVEGAYNGVLEPGTHYLPLKPDFSNLSDILSAMTDDDLREAIADRAYRDVVASHRFEYGAFARLVTSLAGTKGMVAPSRRRDALVAWERSLDGPAWMWVRMRQHIRPALRRGLTRFGLLAPLQRVRKRLAGDESR